MPTPISGEPAYKYEFEGSFTASSPSGDRFQVLTMKIMLNGKEIGLMSIWHNRDGAFAKYVDTQAYGF